MVYQGSGSASPGMSTIAQGGVGTASMPCAVGTQSFTFQADIYPTHNYAYVDYLLAGTVGIALTTAPIASMGALDVSIFANMNGGPFMGMWLGNLPVNYATTTNLIVGQQLGTSFGPAYTSFNWPQSANESAQIPNWQWTIQIIRDGSNNLTFNMMADNYKNGSVPYYSYTVAIPSAYQAKSFQYVSLYTLGTTGGVGSRYDTGGVFTNIRVAAGVTGGTPATVTSISPAAAGGSFQTGQTINLIGTNFNSGASCSVRIGQGSTVQTATPSFVSTSLITVALPTESNGSTYGLHLICNNIDSEYYPGIYYSAPILYSIMPFEVPPTPANSADATVQFAGAGFDSTCTVTFSGISGTVTYNNPTSLSVAVPNGSQGSPAIMLKCNSGATTVYDSTSSGTYPATGKISFGYSGHPYLQFNAAGLPAIQARWINPAYINYTDAVTRAITYDTINGGNPSFRNMAFMDYGYRYLLSGVASDLTAYSAGITTANQGDFYNQLPLDTVNLYWDGFPAGLNNAALPVAQMYDLLFPSLTPTQRAQYEVFLQNAVNYFYYAKTNDPSGSGSDHSWPNRVVITQGGGGVCLLALYSSLQSLRGYAAPTTYVNTSAQILLSAIDTQLLTWAGYTWMPDGGYVEGILYAQYGTTAYDVYARARINTNTLVGNSPADPGFFATNYQYVANFVNTLWDGAALTTFNDSQPLVQLIPQMIDIGQRTGNAQLTWMADWFMYLEDAAQQPNATYCAPLNCVMGGNRWMATLSDVLPYAQYAMMWRSSNPSTTISKVNLPSPSLLTSTQWGSIKSQTNTATPDLYIGLKGSSNHEVGTQQHHENDTCTFTLSSQGEQFLLDPGYNLPAAINHNSLSVDGNTVGGGNTNVTTLGTASNNGSWQVVPMVCGAAYSAGVTAMRRTWVMYTSGASRFAFVLDDITPSGAGAIVEYLQSLPAVSSASNSGFTMKGQRSEVIVKFNGPTNTEANAAGSPAFTAGGSWIYYSMPSIPANYTTATNSYTADATKPEVTTFSPAALDGTGATTAVVAYTTGVVTVTLSDGSTITFGNGSGSWLVSASTVVGGMVAQ